MAKLAAPARVPKDRLVLFVDMLGFASLLKRSPADVYKLQPVFRALSSMDSLVGSLVTGQQGPLVARFAAFHSELETRIRHYAQSNITAITFSDSAFVSMPNPFHICEFAGTLMRTMIAARVPVRMGIGAGSFAAVRFVSDNTDNAHVHTSQFLGTAVVNAYRAEHCGLSGLQIFLHPSASKVIREGTGVEYIRLDNATPDANAELNYLDLLVAKVQPGATTKLYDSLKSRVEEMSEDSPSDKRHYYKNTLRALQRMKQDLPDDD